MRLLTGLLLILATVASAQWQTVRIFSLSDKTYKEYLLAQNQIAKKIGNPISVTDTHMRLSKGEDPKGYAGFTQDFKKEIEGWAKTTDVFRDKKIEVILEPYGTEPNKGDIQVWVVWYRGPGILPLTCPGSLSISGGVLVAVERTKTIITQLENFQTNHQTHR